MEFTYIHSCFEDMIAVSKNTFKPVKEPFKIESFIKQILGLVKMQHDLENIRLLSSISMETPEKMIGD